MQKPYFCVSVHASSHNRRRDIVITELKKILSDKNAEFVVVDDADILSTGEFYVFVRSDEFANKHPMISALQAVSFVHCTHGIPYAFPESEVKKFFKDVEIGHTEDGIKQGDIVCVRRGYLKNLHGVVKSINGNKCKVYFSIHTRCFIENINKSWVNKTGTLLVSKPQKVPKETWIEKFTKTSVGKKKTCK
jgi:transcription antitermination factor NusG